MSFVQLADGDSWVIYSLACGPGSQEWSQEWPVPIWLVNNLRSNLYTCMSAPHVPCAASTSAPSP